MTQRLFLISCILIVNICLANQCHFVGTIETHPVQMDITIDGKDVHGFYYYEKTGKLIWLDGTIASNGSITIDELQGDPKHTWGSRGIYNAIFSGSITKFGKFEGKWKDVHSISALNFSLRQVAGYSSITAKNGRKLFTSVTPNWIDNFKGRNDISRMLSEDAARDKRYQFSQGIEGDVLYANKLSKYEYTIYYYSEKIISFKVDVWTDPGENHPDHITTTMDYEFVKGNWKQIKLREVIDNIANARSVLLAIIKRDLKRQRTETINNINFSDLDNFLITSSSITFIFNPYIISNCSVEYVVELQFAKAPRLFH